MTLTQTPLWARIVAPVASIWYAFGLSQAAMAFAADATAAPMLIWLAYGLACVAGLVGSVALFFGAARAPLVFGISLLSAVIYFGWLFTLGAPAGEDYGIGAMVVAVTAILCVASRRVQA